MSTLSALARQFSVLLFLLWFTTGLSWAETKVIIAEGGYTMGDGETPTVAEARALHNAKRIAAERAGTYVESYSNVKNNQLSADEIQTIASVGMEVEVLEKKRTVVGDGFHFYVKIKATVTTEKMDELLTRLERKDIALTPDLVRQYKKLQDDYDRLAKDLESLKEQLLQAKTKDEKEWVVVKIAKQEQLYTAREWVEKADQTEDPSKSIEYYAQAIDLDPSYRDAYFMRSGRYLVLENLDSAITDLTQAIRLDPQNEYEWILYFVRGYAFFKNEQYEQAVSDFTQYIQHQKMRSAGPYYFRGRSYDALRRSSLALTDYTEAIRLDPNMSEAYFYRGQRYVNLHQYESALVDANTAIRLNPHDEKAYILRALVYGFMRKPCEGSRDFQIACDRKHPFTCAMLDELRERFKCNSSP